MGGGLTYDELVTGLRKAVVATANIIQFNWNHSTTPRTEGFAAGASFTMKQGAPLPYNGKDAYVQLDADYTFTFQAPTDSSTQYNTIVITKQKTRTVSLGGNTSFTYRAEGNNLIFDSINTTSDANSGDYYIVDYNNNTLDESYEEYIDFAGFSLAELKDTYQMRIKFTLQLYVLGEYGLSGETYVSTNDTDKYVDFMCETDSFSNTTEVIQIRYTDPEIMKNYFEVSGKSYDDLTANGYMLRAYRLDDTFKRLRFSYSTLGLNDGDTVLFKKGFPVEYTTTAGKARIEILDKDYGYVYDADTNTFTYDSTLGNSEVDTFIDVTIKKLGSISAFNTTSNAWDIYPIPKRPANVPGIEDVTTFEAKYEINDKEYNGKFTRSDDTNGLYLTIPAENLAADADGVFVTIKAGEYASDGTSASINITDDYVIYVHHGALTQYEGDVYCETDSDTYIVSEADTVQIDGETYQRGAEYAKIGTHVLTYTVDEYTYAKRLVIYRIGDINDDSEISVTDLVAIKKRIAGKREVSMSGIEASDMDMDDAITTYDTNLLRKYLVTEQGVLVLSPREGYTVANASDAAEGLIVDYYYEKSKLYKTGEDIYHRDITVLKWLSFEDVETYTVALATTEDMSDSVFYQTTDCSLKLMNLLSNTDYYWTVTAGEFVSPIQTFHTADTIRTITVEGVSNTRDGGGWITEDGKVVKQGMFYRGGKLDDITASGLTVMNEQLGIKTDMDLRNSSETDGISSPLGDSVQYLNYSGPYYWGSANGINTEAYREALVNEIRTFANEENYPIYVHCSLGRDRTGTICFLINALLGVSEEDLYLDYEFSFLSVTGTYADASVHTLVGVNFATMYNNVKAYAPDGTMADATEAFMLSIGVTQEEINMIRQLLLNENDSPVNIGVYDLETYMTPVWDGRVVHNETVMFLGMDDEVSLLYDADEIISVCSYDLKTEYEQGVDYDYVDGKLVLLQGTRIPCIDKSEYYTSDSKYSQLVTQGNAAEGTSGAYPYWGEGDTMTKWQVAVTYKHSQFWDGYTVECHADKYQALIQKLQNGEDVTFIFYGDSITYGANSSFMIGVEPYAPTWPLMFTQYLAKQYGYTVKYIQNEMTKAPVPTEDTVFGSNGTITYYNPSVGGWTVQNGYDNVENYVNTVIDEYGCDLFTVAFGMNNGKLSAGKFVQYTEKLIECVQPHDKDTSIVMVSTMVPNPEATNGWYGNQDQFEAKMIVSADAYYDNGTSCSVACMTSMSKSVLEHKRFRDYTGNNINHPNDFMARLYAQVMYQTVFGYENN